MHVACNIVYYDYIFHVGMLWPYGLFLLETHGPEKKPYVILVFSYM